MVNTNDDLKFYLSGTGNTNPFDSIGGPFSGTLIQTDQLQNLWNDILPEETLGTGFTDYRLIYLKNTHPTDPISSIHVYWATDDPYTDLEVTHRGINQSCERLTNVFTSPSKAEIGEPTTVLPPSAIVPNADPVNVNSFGIRKFFPDPPTPRYYTTFKNSGSMGASDGYRFDWVLPMNVLSTEVGALITITKEADDNISYKLGGGNHTTINNKQTDGCCYDIATPMNARTIPYHLKRECPHPVYYNCSNTNPLFKLPKLQGKEIGVICIKCNKPDNNVLIQTYVNLTPINANGTINNDTWQKYFEYTDTGSCHGTPQLGPQGGTRQDTIRIDLATFKLRFGSVREIVYTTALPPPPDPTPTCPSGQHYDSVQQKCVPDVVNPPPPTPITDPWLKSSTTYTSTNAIISVLPAQSYIGIWIRRVIPPNVSRLSIDSSELIAEGTGVTS